MSNSLTEEEVRRIVQEELPIAFDRAFQKTLGIMSQEYVNGVNACRILGKSAPTLAKYVKIGSIKQYRFGGDPQYKVSELLKIKVSGPMKN